MFGSLSELKPFPINQTNVVEAVGFWSQKSLQRIMGQVSSPYWVTLVKLLNFSEH